MSHVHRIFLKHYIYGLLKKIKDNSLTIYQRKYLVSEIELATLVIVEKYLYIKTDTEM